MARPLVALCFLLGLVPRIAVSAECDPAAMVDNCYVTVSGAKYRFLAIGLCKGVPTLPAVGRPFNYDNCTLIYDKLNQDGVVLEWTKEGDFSYLTRDLVIPPNGNYDYFVWGNGLEFSAKVAMEFPVGTKTVGDAGVLTTGRFCRTVNGERFGPHGGRHETAECSAAYQEPEYSTWDWWTTGGIDTTRRLNSNYDLYYIKSDLTLATTFSNAVAVIAVHQLPTPITITDETYQLNLDWDFDQQLVIDIETGGDVDGWFLPTFGSPPVTVSVN